MMVNQGEFFRALGFNVSYYDDQTKHFEVDKITARIRQIIDTWKPKYPNLKMKLENLKYDSLVSFNVSFTTEVEYLNVETSR